MANDKSIQKAGDNANQWQIESLTIVNGITEQRARELYSEMSRKAIEDCTSEAVATALARAEMFANDLIPRVEKIESDFRSFSEPSFQFLLKSAQKTAVCSGREIDYELLSELLVHRIKRGTERKTSASIIKAVEIVDQIDDDALCGLTIAHIIGYLYPVTGYISEGLDRLESLYDKLLNIDLPNGYAWLEHLEMLNAIKITSFASNQSIETIMSKHLAGYICVGIKMGSENHLKAQELLQEAGLNPSALVEHELLEGYVRLAIANELQIEKIAVIEPDASRQLNEKEKDALKAVLALYELSDQKKQQVLSSFMKEFKQREALKKVVEFWSQIPRGIELTPIGRVLAHANAQRYDDGIPDFT